MTRGTGTATTRPTRRVLTAVLVTALLAAGVGFAAGWFVRSPAQVAADTAPPEPSAITAPVAEGVITDPLLVSGTVEPGETLDFSPPPPAGVDAIVTDRPVAPGATATPGTVILEVSDRPVILLSGAVPLLRDLRLGDRGDDVARLQASLAAWGAPEPDGILGPRTRAALRALYASAGYTAPEESAALKSELVFAPVDSVRILSVGGEVGAAPATPAITVAVSAPVVTAVVPEVVGQELAVGKAVTVDGAAVGAAQPGSVLTVGAPVKTDTGSIGVTVTFAMATAVPPESFGATVTIAILPDEEPVSGLIVPLSAILSDSDGRTFVQTTRDSSVSKVFVVVEETGSGRARVTAPGGDLAVGDAVVVGAQ